MVNSPTRPPHHTYTRVHTHMLSHTYAHMCAHTYAVWPTLPFCGHTSLPSSSVPSAWGLSPLPPAPFPRKVYRFNRGKIYKETNVLQRHQGSECKNPKGNEYFGTTKEASAPASSPQPRYFLLNRVQFSQPYLPVFLSLLILCWAMGTVRAFMCPVRCER